VAVGRGTGRGVTLGERKKKERKRKKGKSEHVGVGGLHPVGEDRGRLGVGAGWWVGGRGKPLRGGIRGS